MLFASLPPQGVRAQSDVSPPLPDRNPMRPGTAVAVPPKPLLPGEEPTVPWTEAEIDAAKATCRSC